MLTDESTNLHRLSVAKTCSTSAESLSPSAMITKSSGQTKTRWQCIQLVTWIATSGSENLPTEVGTITSPYSGTLNDMDQN